MDVFTMAKYELKTYVKGFEVDQEKIGKEVTKDWDSFHQSSAENLAQNYSQEGFDPETRHYCFHEGKMVGFLVSKILPVGDDGVKKAALDFPLVMHDHEAAADLLYEKAISTLKSKDVQIVEGRAGYYWKGTIEKTKKYGHKLRDSQFCRIVLDLTAKESVKPEFTFEPFNNERDSKELIELMKELYNITDEQAKANIDAINDSENNNLFCYLILRKDNKIVSRGLVSKGPRPKMLSVRPPAPDLTYLKSYVATVVKLAKEEKYEILESFLGPEDYNRLDIFAEAGFTLIGVINYYVKEL